MTHFLNFEELEKEILYLQEQNQKLIQELSEVVKENHRLREEMFQKKKSSEGRPANKKDSQSTSQAHDSKSYKGGGLCLN
ncbi:MAG: hypothetical protein AB7P17_00315 [Nitrospirales bacterium]|nr:hypothetical protein [Nitrospirales bacterium]